MKIYDILIKDVYTDEKRSETMQCDETADIRDIHKQAMKAAKYVLAEPAGPSIIHILQASLKHTSKKLSCAWVRVYLCIMLKFKNINYI